LLVGFVIAQVPVSFLLASFDVAALMTAKGEILKSFNAVQRQDYAMLFLKIKSFGIVVLEIFWGLWLFPFAKLVYRSGFIPRVFGIFLLVNGIAYLLVPTTFILLPQYKATVQQYIFPLLFGELAIMLWLLIVGAREHLSITVIAERESKLGNYKVGEQFNKA